MKIRSVAIGVACMVALEGGAALAQKAGPTEHGIRAAYWDYFAEGDGPVAIGPDLVVDLLVDRFKLTTDAASLELYGEGDLVARCVAHTGTLASILAGLGNPYGTDHELAERLLRVLREWPADRKELLVDYGFPFPVGDPPFCVPIRLIGEPERWRRLQSAAQELGVATAERICAIALRVLGKDDGDLHDHEEYLLVLRACYPRDHGGLVQHSRALVPVRARLRGERRDALSFEFAREHTEVDATACGIRAAYRDAVGTGDALAIGPDLAIDHLVEPFMAVVQFIERDLAEELVHAAAEGNPEVAFAWSLLAGVTPERRREVLGPLVPRGFAVAWPRTPAGLRLEASQFVFDRAGAGMAEPEAVAALRRMLGRLWGEGAAAARGLAPYVEREPWHEYDDVRAFAKTKGCLPSMLAGLGDPAAADIYPALRLLHIVRDWPEPRVERDTADPPRASDVSTQPIHVAGTPARWRAVQDAAEVITGVVGDLANHGVTPNSPRALALTEIERDLAVVANLCRLALLRGATGDGTLHEPGEIDAFVSAIRPRFDHGLVHDGRTLLPISTRAHHPAPGVTALGFEFTRQY